jgi:hypothetical protein
MYTVFEERSNVARVDGYAVVVRNGYAKCREVFCGAGAVEIKAPWVNDRRVDEDGNRRRFKSVILPPYVRRSPKVPEVLPLLYLHGLSSGDFVVCGDYRPPYRAVAVRAGELHEARSLG